LRRLPHPYRAAVAISNDAEFVTPRAFWDIHRFLNTTEATPLGDGLGIQVSDSVFMYSADPRRSFSYFEGTSFQPSAHAGWLSELMRSGCADVLHAYGDFDGVGGCSREHAERALDELDRNGVSLRVWTNHGSIDNTQNLGGSRASYQRGDLPGAEEYHSDLLTGYGIRFVWTDWCSTMRFGQEVPVTLRERAAAMVGTRALRGGRVLARERRLLERERLRDGSEAYLFRRYRGQERPDPTTLPAQLSEANLRQLLDEGGIAIVYQHLGCDRRSGACVPNAAPYFQAAEVSALRRLAGFHWRGEILVSSVSTLLRLSAISSALVWKVESGGDRRRIEIEAVDDPVLGTFVPAGSDLEGISFETDRPADVFLAGRPLQVERDEGRDGSGAVTIPLRGWELPARPRELAG
jgi:hypothetical protein